MKNKAPVKHSLKNIGMVGKDWDEESNTLKFKSGLGDLPPYGIGQVT